MSSKASAAAIDEVVRHVRESGCFAHVRTESSRTVIACLGERPPGAEALARLPGVTEVVPVKSAYKLASRTFKPEDTVIELDNGARIGGQEVALMAGPCTVESRGQLANVAPAVRRAGARIMRGGAFKPRTSPYAFQGMGEVGLRLLRDAASREGLALVSEVMEISQIPMMLGYVDVLQVGARNMQNFDLLKALGKIDSPVLLKRGLAATLEELLLAAEYLLAGGNTQVILCERGIRTFERATRNTLDLSAIPVLKGLTHLPVIVDPSHATGLRDKVIPMSRAAVAAGADGLLIEVHDQPEKALCDGAQSLLPAQLLELSHDLARVAAAVGRSFAVEDESHRRLSR